MMQTISSPQDVQKQCLAWKSSGQTVALVPTMGALHEGHLNLVNQAKKLADRVVVSIFVNPLQFGPTEDFDKYPRTLTADVELLSRANVDIVFAPNASSMYPKLFQTSVLNLKMKDILCGKVRAGHFDGVCTVVLKLFNITQPTLAVFGKKDYQQLSIIKQMVADLNVPIKIVAAETVRESSGLALSSRNRYMSSAEKGVAEKISQSLLLVQQQFEKGERNVAALKNLFIENMNKFVSDTVKLSVEYCEIRSQDGLEEFENEISQPAVILVALKFPSVRLIDNLELKPRA